MPGCLFGGSAQKLLDVGKIPARLRPPISRLTEKLGNPDRRRKEFLVGFGKCYRCLVYEASALHELMRHTNSD